MWILGKRYSMSKYASVLLVTVGIIVCTLATTSSYSKPDTVVENQREISWLAKVLGGVLIFCQMFH